MESLSEAPLPLLRNAQNGLVHLMSVNLIDLSAVKRVRVSDAVGPCLPQKKSSRSINKEKKEGRKKESKVRENNY